MKKKLVENEKKENEEISLENQTESESFADHKENILQKPILHEYIQNCFNLAIINKDKKVDVKVLRKNTECLRLSSSNVSTLTTKLKLGHMQVDEVDKLKKDKISVFDAFDDENTTFLDNVYWKAQSTFEGDMEIEDEISELLRDNK